jgi:aspartate/methionine/tyrosine aminotransferase
MGVAYPFCLVRWLARAGLAGLLPGLERRSGGAGGYLRHYSGQALATPFEELRDSLAYREPAGHPVIDLAHGDPNFDLLPGGVSKLAPDQRGLPPAWGLPELQRLVAAKLHDDLGPAFPPDDEILITAGVSGAFNLALDAFINPGDRVVLFDPSSYLYSFALRRRRARIRWVPTWLEDGRICFHLEALRQALRGARLLVVNTPANPTGGVLTPESLQIIAWQARKHDLLIFSDDAFERFQYEEKRVSITEFREAAGRTLLAGSVSKGHALAAARVGWLAGHRHLVRPCLSSAVMQRVAVPTLCQQQAVAALRQGDQAFRSVHEEFAARRRYVFHRLEALGLEPSWPAGAFYCWVPVGLLGLSGGEFARQLLAAHQVLVWPGDFFGPSGSQHIRISYCGDEGRLREGLNRLGDFVKQLQSRLDSGQRRFLAHHAPGSPLALAGCAVIGGRVQT